MDLYAPIRSAEQVETIVSEARTESATLDFKTQLNRGQKGKSASAELEAQIELARDVAQFANTMGGTLLIGVREERNAQNLKVAREIVGVEEPDQVMQWIDQVMPHHLVPQTTYHTVDAIQVQGRVVLAINVEPQVRLVAVLLNRDKYTQEYCRRTSYGRRFMSPDDVLTFSSASRRSGEIALRRAAARATDPGRRVRLVAGVYWSVDESYNLPRLQLAKDVEVRLNVIDEEDFELAVTHKATSMKLRVPFGAIRDAWCTADGWLGLALVYKVIRSTSGLYELSDL